MYIFKSSILILVVVIYVEARCPALKTFENGFYSCGNRNQIGSTCNFGCYEGFSFVEETYRAIECLPDNTWNRAPPTCAGLCPKFAKADIVFLLDSSTSVKGVTRRLMTRFVKKMISEFTISSEYVNVAIVPYHKGIVLESTILLDQFKNDKDTLLEVLDFLPRNARGSLTGKALNYVIDVILSESNGNRPDAPDILITLTDGRGQDSVDPGLQTLRSMGVTTYAVGFHPRQMPLLVPQLMKLAGNNSERMHITERRKIGNFEVLKLDVEKIYCTNVKKMEPHPPALDEPEYLSDCDNLGELEYGIIECEGRGRSGSQCSFQCTEPDFQLYPKHIQQTRCEESGNWSLSKPCCAPICPPFARMDVVLVLDSSSSVGLENWNILKEFVINLVSSFELGKIGGRFAVFRYNTYVDKETQIMLGDFLDDKEKLLEAIDDIPYNGFGTYTGQALFHAKKYVLGVGKGELAPGNRPDVHDAVIVVTDGWSKDSVKEISEELRDAGVQTYAVGVQRSGMRSFNTTQILDIAGSPDRMFLAEEGFNQLSKNIQEAMIYRMCSDPC